MRHEISQAEAAAIRKARAPQPILSSLDPRYAASEQCKLDEHDAAMELKYNTQ